MNLERLQSVLLTGAALAMAAALLHREFAPGARVPRPPSSTVADWREILPAGRVIGDTSARIKLIEFADLQCPFCKQFNIVARSVVARYPKDVALVFVHYPLAMHPFAAQAARAAECAGAQGRFGEMVDAVYGAQDLLGSQPWENFAVAAGVRDVGEFGRCVRDTTMLQAIDRGLQTAKHFDVRGTPTVLINERRFVTTPTDTELVRAIEGILASQETVRRD